MYDVSGFTKNNPYWTVYLKKMLSECEPDFEFKVCLLQKLVGKAFLTLKKYPQSHIDCCEAYVHVMDKLLKIMLSWSVLFVVFINLHHRRWRRWCFQSSLFVCYLQNRRFFKYIGQSILLFCLSVCLQQVTILNRSSRNFTTW